MNKFFLVLLLAIYFLTSPNAVYASEDIKFPSFIICKSPNLINDTEGEPVKLYTRLPKFFDSSALPSVAQPIELWKSGEAKPDETAAESGDYRSAQLDEREFSYNVTTCDSWDYYYRFYTPDIAEPAESQIQQKPVTGILRTEVRDLHYLNTVDCTAYY